MRMDLASSYEMGLKIIDEIGEEKLEEMMENVEIDKPDIAEELDTIIMGNDVLRERIYTLNEMNSQEIHTTNFLTNPIICAILLVITIIFLCLITPINILIDYILAPLGSIELCWLVFLIFSPLYFIAIVSAFTFWMFCIGVYTPY